MSCVVGFFVPVPRAKEIAQAHHREKEVEFQLRLSELERQRGRDQQLSENMEYLKNVVVGYMEDSANHEVCPAHACLCLALSLLSFLFLC